MHVLCKDGVVLSYPYSQEQLRADNLGTSFPGFIPDERLADWGVFPVTPTAQPEYDEATHKLIEGAPLEVSGVWTQDWEVVALTTEEQAAQAAMSQEANAQRAKADLEETDWSENPSVRNTSLYPHLTNAADFDAYRLALRVIVIERPVVVASWPVRPESVWSQA